MNQYRVLIVDDEPSIHKLFSRICELMSWQVDSAYNGHDALSLIEDFAYPICVLDVKMQGPSGIDLAEKILEKNPASAIIIFTGYAKINDAVTAIKRGVYDYIRKEAMDVNSIKQILIRAAEFYENRKKNVSAQNERLKHFSDIESANQTFQSILDMCGELIFLVDAINYEIIDCNMTAVDQLKCSHQQIIGQSFTEFCREFGSTSWKDIINYARSNQPAIRETEMNTATGDAFPTEISCGYVALETGEFLSIIVRDITKRKIVEEKLQLSNQQLTNYTQKLKTLIDSIEDGIMFTNKDGIVDMMNSGMIRLLKATEEFVIGKNVFDVLGEVVQDNFDYIYHSYCNGESLLTEKKRTTMGDKQIILTFQPVLHNEEFMGIVISISDISEVVHEQQIVTTDYLHQKKMFEYKSNELLQTIENLKDLICCLKEMNLTTEQEVLVDSMLEYSESINDCNQMK